MGLFRSRHLQPTPIEAPEVIDLREPRRPAWGQAADCPDCGHLGYVDHIDIRLAEMTQHCPQCGAAWAISRADCLQSV